MKTLSKLKPRTLAALAALLLACSMVAAPPDASAFCGFYVGKADTGLYNQASQVVMVHHEDKTVISMMNDYQGEPSEFALVVPVPTVLQKGQVHVGDRELFKHLDAYSSPRLVEYFDANPCQLNRYPMAMLGAGTGALMAESAARPEAKSLGVTIEAQYTVGEYDIVILSAKESDGLETWLQTNGYKIPLGASQALKPYIKQNMKFFVAKVNLKEHARGGLTYLRPLQFAFESSRFMLPIRLGMINSQGPQDLIIYMLTRDGRVEATNYRTEKVPAGDELPEYIKSDFGSFYKAVFDQRVKTDQMQTVLTEYFWNMGWCDPCAAQPLSRDELRSLGVFWLDDQPQANGGGFGGPVMVMPMMGGQMPVMLTRLHVRYSASTFPEDLVFQETQDTQNYQARYVIRHPWQGTAETCPAAKAYNDQLEKRRATEAQTLVSLTGWDSKDVFKKVGLKGDATPSQWWQSLWPTPD